LLGHIAKRQASINPENTFFGVKRFIGRTMDEVQDEMARVPFHVVPDENGNVRFSVPALGKLLSPEEISAQVIMDIP
jgi:molecular chaperone DnaK